MAQAGNCSTGKRCYRDSIAAGRALGVAAAQIMRDGPRPIRSYRCDRCPYYHLSSKPLTHYPSRRPTAT